MDGDTLRGWVGDPDGAPLERRGAALTVRAFLAGPDPGAHAADVAGLPGDVAIALVAVLEAAADADRLGLVKLHASDRAARKAAGKAIHRLRSRGVLVPEERRATGRKVEIGRPASPPSWITHHDYSGSAVTILGDWDASYGPFFVLAVESEEAGLQVSDLVRGATRKMERALMVEMQLEDKGVPVSANTARALLAEAARRTKAAGRPLPAGWDRIAPFVAGADPILARPSVALPEVDWERALDSPSAPLLAIVGNWLPDRAAFDETILALHAAASSELAISEDQRAEFVEDALARRMDAWFDARHRTSWALRFERAALLLDHRKEPAAAVAALAAARWLRDGERSVSSHPVLRVHWEQLFDVKDLMASFERDDDVVGQPEPERPESLILRP